MLIHELINQLPDIDEINNIKQDPVFQMEGYDSKAKLDLSKNIDKYFYEEK